MQESDTNGLGVVQNYYRKNLETGISYVLHNKCFIWIKVKEDFGSWPNIQGWSSSLRQGRGRSFSSAVSLNWCVIYCLSLYSAGILGRCQAQTWKVEQSITCTVTGVGGWGLKSHLEACSQYSSHPMPFIKKCLSRANITDRPLIDSSACHCFQSNITIQKRKQSLKTNYKCQEQPRTTTSVLVIISGQTIRE